MISLVQPLAAWLGGRSASADPSASCRLETRDAGLTEARALLCCAVELISDVVARHRPEANGPAAAVELDLIAERLSALDESYSGSEDNPVVLRRAAVLCAGEQWQRLAGLLPSLRLRMAAMAEAIGSNAVALSRLDRPAPPALALAPSPEVAAFAAAEAAVDEELRRRTAKAGADSAYAAADAVFLPSLADFLR